MENQEDMAPACGTGPSQQAAEPVVSALRASVPDVWVGRDLSARQHIVLEQRDPELAAWAALNEGATPYGWSKGVCFLDFNREMFAPGQHEKYPDGAVGIRTDDDFWLVACLPWRFRVLRLDVVCSTLWPEAAADPEYSLSYDRGPAADLALHDRFERLGQLVVYAKEAFAQVVADMEELRLACAAGNAILHDINWPRDSDGNPEGGDSEAAPSQRDDSAAPTGIAQPSQPSSPQEHKNNG